VGNGEPDADTVRHGYGLAPLSRPSAPYDAPVASTRGDDPVAPAELVDRLDAEAFFRMACRLLEDNPPRTEDRRLVERVHQVGLFTRSDEPWMGGDAALQRMVEQGARRGRASVRHRAAAVTGDRSGQWHIEYRCGDFGTDYLSRAAAACAPAGVEIPDDAVPALTRTDAEGRPLSGRHRYVLRFGRDVVPPVYGSWALSTYAAAEGRSISLGDRDGLTLDEDGSLPIHIQRDRPERARRSNWLPAPSGDFTLVLRLFWPREEVLTRRWTPPAVARIG
jgi:hypothetical protein